jgi:hypothetical protein
MLVKSFKDWLLAVMGLSIVGLATFVVIDVRSRGPAAPAAVNGAALGRTYAPAVVSTLSDAWIAAADALAQGKTVTEAQTILQDKWKADRGAAFTAKVSPGFARVLTEATEPKDAAQRAEVVALWKSFASGLKGGR